MKNERATTVFQSSDFRVVAISNQWIIQKQYLRKQKLDWQYLSYHLEKDSLIRVYVEKSGDTVGAAVLNDLLPSSFQNG